MPQYPSRARQTIDPGQMRDRIGIYEIVVTHDHGERTTYPRVRAGLRAVPAVVEYETAAEAIRAGRPDLKTGIKISLRDGYTIDPADVILWDEYFWEVRNEPIPIDTIERFVMLRAVMVSPAGGIVEEASASALLSITATAVATEVSGSSRFLVYGTTAASRYSTHEYGYA